MTEPGKPLSPEQQARMQRCPDAAPEETLRLYQQACDSVAGFYTLCQLQDARISFPNAGALLAAAAVAAMASTDAALAIEWVETYARARRLAIACPGSPEHEAAETQLSNIIRQLSETWCQANGVVP